ncbi:MAG: hypothetical protein HUJ94_06395 [Bacteroidales bacterium]|nr:hypothetical protein [Bacteroidales bacterium]
MANYRWNFCKIGGVTRVSITKGEDIAHLEELDQKMWTALSCPVNGLEFDTATLALLDADNDGKIRVNEVVAASKWLGAALKNLDCLLTGDEALQLSAINGETEEGGKLLASASQVLANLGKADADAISVADTSDSVAIFAKTRFNGDGIITASTAEDEALKALIADIITVTGALKDRSGEDGVDEAKIEEFYAACADYSAWKAAAEADEKNIFPFGADTEAAFAACEAVKAKVADYFMRCKLVGFNAGAAPVLDVSVDKIQTISGNDLSSCAEEIASYPLARVTDSKLLPLTGLNPAWAAAFEAVKTLALGKLAEKEAISEDEWNGVLASFAPYTAWKEAKKGAAVEALGDEKVEAIVKAAQKDALLSLVAQDKALEAEAAAIADLDKLTRLHRDFAKLLNNFVTMSDFYSNDKLAIFQAGRLYIDQKSCDLCVKIADMGKQGDVAVLSGLYLVYCTCTSKTKGQTINIVAALTDGDTDNIRVGMNAVFYDRDGVDYDAVVTKIVDNPISIRQAFLSPYKKLGRFISEKIEKSAAEKEGKATSNLISKADNISVPTTEEEAKAAAKPAPFDIARFAGIFAAIGMAVGFIAQALVSFANGVTSHWYVLPLLVIAVIVLVSGPSMFLAWLKLRKRNLAPVLNSNGWAVNSHLLVNTRFGSTLTNLVSFPVVKAKDPYEKPGKGLRTTIWILVLLCGIFAALFFTDSLRCVGLPFHKEDVEEVIEEPAPAEEDAPEEEAAAETATEETPAE